MKTILITGGSGFIGAHVNKLLALSGYRTVILDNLSRSHSKTFKDSTFVKGDIGNREDLKKIFTQFSIDAVMHLAAYTDVGESVKNPSLYYHNNLVGTLTLLQSMLEHGVEICVFSSTAAIFGYPLQTSIDESHPCNPINPYGNTKWMAEKILQDLSTSSPLRFASLRYFNAAGGDPTGEVVVEKIKENNLIPIVLKGLISNKPITIFGTDYPTPDGTCIRDYIHVYDLATAHILCLEKLLHGAESDYFNLGNGQGFSVLQVIQAVEKVTGLKVNAINGERRAGDPPILIANSNKAYGKLHWKPSYPELETIIKHAWQSLYRM
jgi:UDP-glucose 4-epimerase